jgi:hypothetical protein
MVTDKSKKVAQKYLCENCNYSTYKKTDFNKHLATRKHKIVTDSYDLSPNLAEKCYGCECGKSYKHRQNLYTHKKKCIYKKENEENKLIEMDKVDYKDLFIKMIHENSEMRKAMVMENQGFRDQISELIPKVGNNNNNTIKQKFNINIFLNEECKDALTMNEFIGKIKVTLDDLLITKNKGLSEGVSNIFIENMNKLSLHERPIHCTDTKRETVYIKCDEENNEGNSKWEKDDENIKLKMALKKVSEVQQKNLDKWTKEHPNWVEDQVLQQEYMTLVKNCTDDLKENKREDRVIKKVCSEVYLSNGLNKLLKSELN